MSEGNGAASTAFADFPDSFGGEAVRPGDDGLSPKPARSRTRATTTSTPA